MESGGMERVHQVFVETGIWGFLPFFFGFMMVSGFLLWLLYRSPLGIKMLSGKKTASPETLRRTMARIMLGLALVQIPGLLGSLTGHLGLFFSYFPLLVAYSVFMLLALALAGRKGKK